MSDGTFLTPDDRTFDRDVLEREGTVLVDFWAPWCGPCRAFKPLVEHVARERASDGLTAAFVNVDETPELSARYGIQSIPAVKLFRGGAVVAELSGARSRDELEAWLDTHAA